MTGKPPLLRPPGLRRREQGLRAVSRRPAPRVLPAPRAARRAALARLPRLWAARGLGAPAVADTRPRARPGSARWCSSRSGCSPTARPTRARRRAPGPSFEAFAALVEAPSVPRPRFGCRWSRRCCRRSRRWPRTRWPARSAGRSPGCSRGSCARWTRRRSRPPRPRALAWAGLCLLAAGAGAAAGPRAPPRSGRRRAVRGRAGVSRPALGAAARGRPRRAAPRRRAARPRRAAARCPRLARRRDARRALAARAGPAHAVSGPASSRRWRRARPGAPGAASGAATRSSCCAAGRPRPLLHLRLGRRRRGPAAAALLRPLGRRAGRGPGPGKARARAGLARAAVGLRRRGLGAAALRRRRGGSRAFVRLGER